MIVYKLVDDKRGSLFVPSPYRLEYHKDTIVTAIEGTVGIMCFDSHDSLVLFLAGSMIRPFYRAITVETLAEVKKDLRICNIMLPTSLEDFYSIKFPFGIMPPMGTIFCDKVKVLD